MKKKLLKMKRINKMLLMIFISLSFCKVNFFSSANEYNFEYKYQANSKENPTYCFRPYIDLLLDESSRAEQKRDGETLTAAVKDFYSNTNS